MRGDLVPGRPASPGRWSRAEHKLGSPRRAPASSQGLRCRRWLAVPEGGDRARNRARALTERSCTVIAQLAALQQPNVWCADGIVRIQVLTSTNPDLVRLVTGTDDSEAVVQRTLVTGARALVAAQASVDTAAVKSSFAAPQGQLCQLVEGTYPRRARTEYQCVNVKIPLTAPIGAQSRWRILVIALRCRKELTDGGR